MKICIVGCTVLIPDPQNTNITTGVIGGIEGYISDHIEYLSNSGIQSYLIGKIFNFHPLDNLEYFEIQKDVSSTQKFLLNLILKAPKINLNSQSIIHAHRPDHLFCFSLFKKNPCILTIHGQQAITVKSRKSKLTGLVYSFMEYFALRKVQKIIATDKITEKFYLEQYPFIQDKIRVISAGINLTKFKPYNKALARKKYGINDDAKCLLYVGRIEPPKRVAEIILSFSLVKEEIPDSIFIIIGDGTEKENIEQLIKQKDLGDSVILMGAKHRSVLPELISIADVGVLYSHNEGSPLSIKECIACGVPVIANNVGDVVDVIDDGITGYVLKKENNHELAQLVMKCFSRSDKMSEMCTQKAHFFSHIHCFDQVQEVYEEVKNDNTL